jgi:hypothetical protein
MPTERKYESTLMERLFEDLGLQPTPAQHDTALGLLRAVINALPDGEDKNVLRRTTDDASSGPSPPHLRRLLGIAALHEYLRDRHPLGLEALGPEGHLPVFLAQHENEDVTSNDATNAALRSELGIAEPQDQQLIDDQLEQIIRRHDMAPDPQFTFDPRATPPGFDEAALRALVEDQLTDNVPEVTPELTAFVLGVLSLDGYLNQNADGQRLGIKQARYETDRLTPLLAQHNGKPDQVTWREALTTIIASFVLVRPAGGPPSYYEEFAFVARRLLANSTQVPVDAPGLAQRIASLLTEYVPGEMGGTLNLPALSGEDGNATELVPENIRAVALVYAAYQLEELRMFAVVDRLMEVFMNGQLPVGFDNGGKALDLMYWDSPQRLTEAARRMQYTRILGAAGGEISREAAPNKSFNDLFLRFLSSLSEYDRQRRVGDVIGGMPREDSLTLTGEQIRKAGRDLAANASLFGYGAAYFVAQRLSKHIERCLTILNLPEIQQAYGVQSAWQVIERVCSQDFGKAPNVVRFRTMAEAGKQILDIVADNSPAWLQSTGMQPLFVDPAAVVRGVNQVSDIDPNTQDVLMRATEHWLAVNGIKEDQRMKLGEPEVIASAPSIPSAGGTGTQAFDQIRQMVTAGQTPSLDQLKGLLPDMGSMIHN